MFGLFKKKKQEAEIQIPKNEPQPVANEINEEAAIAAVIAFALNKYVSEIHDYEEMVLTMQKVMRPYSPWSSKIYSLRQYPFKMRTNFYEKIQVKS